MQSFTVCMPLPMATIVFGLGRRRSQQCFVHCLPTVIAARAAITYRQSELGFRRHVFEFTWVKRANCSLELSMKQQIPQI